jgi:hypothetical protein
MRWLATTIAALLLSASAEASAVQVPDVQAAHIAAHVPAAEDFDDFMVRDLGAFLGARAEEEVTFELLREGPTQSGVSYPKFYLWVRVLSADGDRQRSGAVRVAAVDRLRFEVTDFASREDIVSGVADPASIFPAALVDRVRQRALLSE